MNPAILPADEAGVAAAARLLAAGELVAFPTETVYGLGADAANPRAVRAIFAAKGRPADHPVIVHLAGAKQLDGWARSIPAGARALAAAFWPGPLTLILPRAAHVADIVTGGQDSVGLRVPGHPVARALLERFGGGIAAPSANRFGRISPTTAAHVAADLGDSIGAIIDGGACPVGIESTIVAFTHAEPVLLRPGAISRAALERQLGCPLGDRGAAAPRASGTLASHYAPHTPARLVHRRALAEEVARFAERDERLAVLARSVPRPRDFGDTWLVAPADAAGYARTLYANLRELDASRADVILVEAPPHGPDWAAVADRLDRATHGEDDDRD